MLKIAIATALTILGLCAQANAQTINTESLSKFNPSTVRETYEVCRHVNLTAEQQIKLAKAIEADNKAYVAALSENNGLIHPKAEKKFQKSRDKALAKVLDEEQLKQYYRGIYNAEALAEGNAVASKLRKQYGLTDQNWKFIRNAFHKIGLESRVLRRVMADNPGKAEKAIAKLRAQQLDDIEQRGGIRINDDMTLTVTREFDPNALRK